MIRILFAFTFSLSSFAYANEKAGICASIEDDKNRLACYDQFFKTKPVVANKDIRKKIPAKANIRNPKYQEVTKKVNTKKEVVVNKEINNDGRDCIDYSMAGAVPLTLKL